MDDVLSDTQFTAKRGAGGTTAGAITTSGFMTVMSSAYAEGTGVPRSVSRNPIKFLNYIQIFKDTYELTGTADKTVTRTNNNYSEDKKRKMFKQLADIEWSMLLGWPAETTGENGKPKRFMGGVSELPSHRQHDDLRNRGDAVVAFLDALAPVFNFDTGAGDTADDVRRESGPGRAVEDLRRRGSLQRE